MTRNVRNLGMLAVFAMALTTFVSAQEFAAYRVQASIPVDFIAGDQQLAAGDYLFLVNGENNGVSFSQGASYQTSAKKTGSLKVVASLR